MNKDAFWIFLHLGLGDAIVANGLIRFYSEKYKDRYVILPCWMHNMASIQWMLSDVPNIFFYPIETEQQLLTCRDSIPKDQALCLGFYETPQCRNDRFRSKNAITSSSDYYRQDDAFNPVKWDSEFYRQAGLDPDLKWSGFKLPEFSKNKDKYRELKVGYPRIVVHEDEERGFRVYKDAPHFEKWNKLTKENHLMVSCTLIHDADEIHCIDSSMLNLADLMETPHCKRFVFHRYARKGLPPTLKKNWEIIE